MNNALGQIDDGVMLAVVGGIGILAYVVYKKGIGASAAAVGAGAGSAVVGLANGVATGTVNAIGGIVGVPATDAQKCAAAIAGDPNNASDRWNASLYCPATTFLKFIAGNTSNTNNAAAANLNLVPAPGGGLITSASLDSLNQDPLALNNAPDPQGINVPVLNTSVSSTPITGVVDLTAPTEDLFGNTVTPLQDPVNLGGTMNLDSNGIPTLIPVAGLLN
jgi:hypothetical protein